jgi:type II secretion system protein G
MKINLKLQKLTNRNIFFEYINMRLGSLENGFTLIELLVVIAIIGILTSVLMVNFIGVRQRARDAQRKTQIKQLQAAFEVYRSDKGQYPCFSGGCDVNNASTVDNLTATLGSYLSDDIKDPLNTSACPNYLVSSTGSTYTIYAVLENANDADATADKKVPVANAGNGACASPGPVNGRCKKYTTTTGCSATYTYWVNNP